MNQQQYLLSAEVEKTALTPELLRSSAGQTEVEKTVLMPQSTQMEASRLPEADFQFRDNVAASSYLNLVTELARVPAPCTHTGADQHIYTNAYLLKVTEYPALVQILRATISSWDND